MVFIGLFWMCFEDKGILFIFKRFFTNNLMEEFIIFLTYKTPFKAIVP
jgi:hypothetical protein